MEWLNYSDLAKFLMRSKVFAQKVMASCNLGGGNDEPIPPGEAALILEMPGALDDNLLDGLSKPSVRAEVPCKSFSRLRIESWSKTLGSLPRVKGRLAPFFFCSLLYQFHNCDYLRL
jgi:hypothetical protein